MLPLGSSLLVRRCLNVSCLVLLACQAHDRVLPWQGGAADAGLSPSVDAAPVSSVNSAVSVSMSPDAGRASMVDAALPDAAGSVVAESGVAPAEAGVEEAEAALPPPAPMAKDADCDMNGIWAGRQVTRSEALLAGQFANNWYYIKFEQNGEDVVNVEHWNCGIEVHGSATGKLSRATAEALLVHNSQVGRKGKMYKDATGHCHFQMDRFWSTRGGSEARFVPVPRNASVSLAEVQATNPLPVPARPEGAEDWENDGKLGLAVQISGILSGVRNTVQRDYTEWFSDPARPLAPALDFGELDVRVTFVGEENLFDPTSGLLAQLAQADISAPHRLTLHFLGRSAADPRARAVIKATPFDTCQAIQALLPAKDGLD